MSFIKIKFEKIFCKDWSIKFNTQRIIKLDFLKIAKEKKPTFSNSLLLFELRNSKNKDCKINLVLYVRPTDEQGQLIREKLISILIDYPKLFHRYTSKGEKYLPIYKIEKFLDWSRKDMNQIKMEFTFKLEDFIVSKLPEIEEYIEKVSVNFC